MRIWWLLGCASLALGMILPACISAPKAPQVAVADDSDPHGFVTNIYGQRLSWKGQVPVRIDLHESVPEELIPILKKAMNDWANALGRPVFEIGEKGLNGPKALEAMKDGHNTLYVFGPGEWKGKAEDQAKTYISWTRNQIQEADIVINADNHKFALGDVVLANEVDLESVLVHELGHVLGLDHKDSGPSVMSTWLPEGQKRRTVFKADVTAVKTEYL